MESRIYWPNHTLNKKEKQSEAIYYFTTTNKKTNGNILSLVSNYPYELWLDGTFVGDGGHRCVPGEVMIDHWPEAQKAKNIVVRLHYMHAKECSIWHRCLFDDPFFGQIGNSKMQYVWTCYEDQSIWFLDKVCSQLPRQNLLYSHPSNLELNLNDISKDIRKSWKFVEPTIKKPKYELIDLNNNVKSEFVKHGSSGTFDLTSTKNLLSYVQSYDKLPCDLKYITYDLGTIALYRFQIDSNVPCVLAYSEVSNFDTAWKPGNRKKVHMADGFTIDGNELGTLLTPPAPFGQRGCRYVHLIYPSASKKPTIKAWRRSYQFDWKQNIANDPEVEIIANACKANLVACVDGGVVDTCWRERAQWTGDLRMSAIALNKLANNPEIANFALKQIAQSYDPSNGMVNGCWPMKKVGYKMPMPGYHLAFCLCALEQKCQDPLVIKVVKDSISFWKRNYLCDDGLIRNMPGWYFTDWDPTDDKACGRSSDRLQKGELFNQKWAHAICNVWWYEVCNKSNTDSGFKIDNFNKAFWTPNGYCIYENMYDNPSPHVCATVLCSFDSGILQKNQTDVCLKLIKNRTNQVTAYFSYFTANALYKQEGSKSAIDFIKKYYYPIAKKWGTIYEKTDDKSSLAHGWSIGIAEFLYT